MSSSPEVGLSIIRKAIEERVDEVIASSVVFEALSELPEEEDVPKSLSELTIFVAGPLSRVLRNRLGEVDGETAIEAVKDALASAAIGMPKPAPVPAGMEASRSDSDWPDIVIEETSDASSPEEEEQKRPTLIMAGEESVGETVRVMVIAGTPRLAKQIRAAFGSHRVTVSISSTYEEVTDRLDSFSPSIVIVDGQSEADIPPSAVANLLADAPGALVLVWASDQPWGSAAARKLEELGATFALIPRKTGVQPMLDYVRARFV